LGKVGLPGRREQLLVHAAEGNVALAAVLAVRIDKLASKIGFYFREGG